MLKFSTQLYLTQIGPKHPAFTIVSPNNSAHLAGQLQIATLSIFKLLITCYASWNYALQILIVQFVCCSSFFFSPACGCQSVEDLKFDFSELELDVVI